MPKEQEVFALFPAIIGTFFLYSAFDKSILMNDNVCYWMLKSNKKWCYGMSLAIKMSLEGSKTKS